MPGKPQKQTTEKPKLPTIKPTEWKALVELLSEPAEDAEALAKAVINKLDEVRLGSKSYNWAVVVQIRNDDSCGKTFSYLIYGPFPTRNAAEKAQEVISATYGGSVDLRVGRMVNALGSVLVVNEAGYGTTEEEE